MPVVSRPAGSGLRVVVAGVLLAAGAGCDRPRPAVSKPPPAVRTVRLLNWEEYINPALLADFTARTGIRVDVVTFKDQEDLSSRLRSDPGAYDVAVMDESMIEAMRAIRLLRPLDLTRLPSLKNIDQRYLDGTASCTAGYAVPYLWGTTLLAFRKDKVDPPPRSWNELWNERYAGRIMMLTDIEEVFGVAALALGFQLDPEGPEQMAAVQAKVLAQRATGARYAGTLEIQEALLSGDCWIAEIYSGDAATAADQDPQIGYVIPDEGAPIWVDYFVLSRDAADVAAAHTFIEYVLDPGVAAENARHLRFATPNREASVRLGADAMRDPQIYPPPDVLAKCGFHRAPDRDTLRLYSETWAQLRSGGMRRAGPTPGDAE